MLVFGYKITGIGRTLPSWSLEPSGGDSKGQFKALMRFGCYESTPSMWDGVEKKRKIPEYLRKDSKDSTRKEIVGR